MVINHLLTGMIHQADGCQEVIGPVEVLLDREKAQGFFKGPCVDWVKNGC